VRETDGVYRFGGEEFLLLLHGQDADGAERVMERIRSAVHALKIEHTGDPDGVLTISAGVAAYSEGHRSGTEQLLKEADLALYSAKASGRNRVTVASRARSS
jgi:diguanylate cyclase (GGDEF)-like protein